MCAFVKDFWNRALELAWKREVTFLVRVEEAGVGGDTAHVRVPWQLFEIQTLAQEPFLVCLQFLENGAGRRHSTGASSFWSTRHRNV